MNKTQLFVIVGIVIFSIGISSVYATNTSITDPPVSTDNIISINTKITNTMIANDVESNKTTSTYFTSNHTISTIINATHIGTSDITASNIYVSGTCYGCNPPIPNFIPTDVTSNRTVNTIYHNTTGKPLAINISIYKGAINDLTLSDVIIYKFKWDTANPPTAFYTQDGIELSQSRKNMTSSLFVIVPDGYYYELNRTFVNNAPFYSFTGILQWIEGS